MDSFDTPSRQELRRRTRRFVENEVLAQLAEWESTGQVPRTLHLAAAKAGILGAGYPEDVGGGGGDIRDLAVVTEELVSMGATMGLFMSLYAHVISIPPIITSGRRGRIDLIDRYVRPALAGERVVALGLTEPDAGSDLGAISTTAMRERDHYVVNGRKTFVSAGLQADCIVTAVRTGGAGPRGISLLVIDADTAGYQVGRRLETMGCRCGGFAEISFTECRVPAANLVGAENDGFREVMRYLPAARVSHAVQGYAAARRCLHEALSRCRNRVTFGQPLAAHQTIRHRLAEMASRTEVAQAYTRGVLENIAAGQDHDVAAAMAKNTVASASAYVADEAVQLLGGTGYCVGSPVERLYRDVRNMGSGGGTTEMMNEIIARSLAI